MKKIVVTLFLLMSFTLTFAQSSEHLKFKGVPIDGTLIEYVSKMKQAGFQLVETDNGEAVLEGEFAGYRDCMISVKTLQKQDIVHEIAVLFPSQDKWSRLSYDYERLKSMLTKKYGEPDECVEKCGDYTYDDYLKMNEVRMDRCKYYSIYNVDDGSINLSIENFGYPFGCSVGLWYSDKINSEKFDNAAMEDL